MTLPNSTRGNPVNIIRKVFTPAEGATEFTWSSDNNSDNWTARLGDYLAVVNMAPPEEDYACYYVVVKDVGGGKLGKVTSGRGQSIEEVFCLAGWKLVELNRPDPVGDLLNMATIYARRAEHNERKADAVSMPETKELYLADARRARRMMQEKWGELMALQSV